MKNLKTEKTAGILLTVFTAVLSVISAYFLWKRTNFGIALTSMETRRMLFELTVVFLLLFIAGWHPVSRRLSAVLRITVLCGFLWLHQILVPILLSGLFLLYLLELGHTLAELTGARHTSEEGKRFHFRKEVRFLILGSAMQIFAVCLFSAFGIGGTGVFRIQVLVTAGIMLLLRMIPGIGLTPVKANGKAVMEYCTGKREMGKNQSGLLFTVLICFISTAFLLQAGRINIARDYDSLHYGLRSAFVLDNGRGIYESLGSVNDVYVYPKGFEALTLPLSGLASDAYVQAFSWWMTLLSLMTAASIVNRFVRRPHNGQTAGYAATAVLAAIPGVMNMAASAKTDAVTLTFQLIGILLVIDELSGSEVRFPWAGLAAFVFTLTLKPTSFLFSFLPALCALGFWGYRLLREKEAVRVHATRLGILLMGTAVLATLAVTARTVHLAGVPLTTAGTGLWEKLGFSMKYPFNSLSMGDASDKPVLKRLVGLFACPVGEDMSHVYIAWGSLAVPVCGFLGLLGAVFSGKKEKTLPGILLLAFLAVTAAASVYLTGMLWQLDGNYFMLLYALCVIFGFVFNRFSKGSLIILLPAVLLAAAMTMTTNWAGVLGLSTPKIIHAGFLDRQQADKTAADIAGKGDVYETLAENPRNRVLALADQPECFVFPCNVQSYTDLEGNGGNVAILAHYEDWLDFLDYAQVDYLYVEDDFTAKRPRAYDLVGYMVDDELIRPVVNFESGVLFAYDREYRVRN